MRTSNLIILAVLATVFVGCSQSQTTEQKIVEEVDSTEAYAPEPDFDSVNFVIEESVQPVEPISTPSRKETSSSSYSSSSSSYSSYSDNSSDYWEEKRKTSPNDNYLLGFDEDVDDVHDMEIYMEDY